MSNEIKLSQEQKELIEKLGVRSERHGLPPAHSRITALLIVSPEPELTFDQIRETLNLSKSATSNALNMLLTAEKIDYITRPGDRKRYFKSKIGSWKNEMRNTFKHFVLMADLFEEALSHRPEETVEFNEKLKEIIDFMRYMEKELPVLFKKWEDSK